MGSVSPSIPDRVVSNRFCCEECTNRKRIRHLAKVSQGRENAVLLPRHEPFVACASALEIERFAPMKAHADTSF